MIDYKMHSAPNAAIAKESLTEEVYRILLSRFMNNEFMPGNILNRKELADELNVSVAPVSTALSQLTAEGFVDTIPRKGTIVKAIDKNDVYGSFVMREAIESQAARLYCGQKVKAKEEGLIELAKLVDNSHSDMDSGGENDPDLDRLKAHLQYEINFHYNLVHLSGCKALLDAFSKTTKIGMYYSINNFLPSADQIRRVSHVELVRKLTIDDPEEADRLIRSHLNCNRTCYLKHFKGE